MRYYFIVNPISGSGRGESAFNQARALLDEAHADYGFAFTTHKGHAIELTRTALDSGEKCIIAVGGDGTAQEVASVLAGSDAIMGLLPFGTGNDFARAVGLSKEVDDAVHTLLRSQVRPVDGALANDRFFINVAGFGFDVDVVMYTEKYKSRFNGMMPYMLGVLKALTHLKPVDMEYTLDGRVQSVRALLVDACNGTYFGGGMNLAPHASVFDGKLDICIVKAVNIPLFLMLLPKYIKGKHLGSKHILYFKTDSVTVTTHGQSMLNLDGELGSTTPVVFRVVKQALNFIVGEVN
ncbi:MAG: diacylglycerol kinase family lipid kinase [Clostridia bacterium]